MRIFDLHFMFNYPDPSGDRRRDIFFARVNAQQLSELPQTALDRYRALGYISWVDVDDAQGAAFAAQQEVQVPVTEVEMSAVPRIGPEALPQPLGKRGQQLVKRMQAQFKGHEGHTKLLERAMAEDAVASTPSVGGIEATSETSTRGSSRSSRRD